jgi:hypothetical protein
MANPRNVTEYTGIDGVYATYSHDNTIVYSATEENGSAQVGLAVTIESDKTVTLIGDGEPVEGKLIKVEADGKCNVQVGGYMALPGGDGATLTIGQPIVGDLGAASAEGYIRAANSATAAETINARGAIVDNDTTTAVMCRL